MRLYQRIQELETETDSSKQQIATLTQEVDNYKEQARVFQERGDSMDTFLLELGEVLDQSH